MQKSDSDHQVDKMLKIIQELKDQRNELESQNKVLQQLNNHFLKFQYLSNELLVLFNGNQSTKEIIDATLKSIQLQTKFSAVGMRLKVGNDFPYFSHIGFSQDFIQGQNSLIAKNGIEEICKDEDGKLRLKCTCGLVISGKTDSGNTLYTKAGSFVTNNSYPLLDIPIDEDPRFQPRNTCIHLKYGSIAIIPIEANGMILGTLQLNDKKVNAFSANDIAFFENICASIGPIIMRKQAEEALLENEGEYRNLIRNMPDGIYKSTEEGKFVDVNPAMVKMLGYASQEELLSIDIKTQLYFEISDRDSAVLREKNKELGIFRMKKKDSSEIWVEDHGWLNYDKTNNVLFHEGILRDITERIQAEEVLLKNEENLSITLNSIGDGVIATDKNGLIVRMNPIAENLCGWKLADATGRPLSEVFKIINAETRKKIDDPVKKVFKSGRIVGLANHTVLISRNGTECQISDRAAPIKTKEGLIDGVILVFSDITESYVVQKQIKESENRYRLLVESANEGISVAQGDKLKFINPKLMELLGYTEEELLSIPFIELIHPDYRELIIDNYKKRINGEAVEKSYHVKVLNKDKTSRFCEFSAVKIEWEGKPATMSFIIDITERKLTEDALKESEERYRDIVEFSPEAIIMHQDWTILYANPAAIKLLKANNINDLLGKSSFDLIHPDSRPMMMKRLKIHVKIGDFTPMTEATLLAIDGTPINAEVQSILVNYNGRPAIQASVRDITDRKNAKNEIIKAKELAEESDRLKSAFLANMSHEIRTPMNGILGFTSLLKETDLTVENQQEYIKIIDQSGTRLLNIINDIIDISKIESNQMMVSLSETNVNEKIKFIYDFFKPETSSKGIYLNFKNGLTKDKALISTDGEKIYAILTNLVKNAIKFCDHGIIDFGYELKTDCKIPELEFYVKDSGVGIPNGRQHAVFDRFIQADISDKRAFQGAGLGLSISKAYVEMLGGKIWVESEVGVGSSFYFTIPYNTIQKKETAPIKTLLEKEPENQVKNLKILIVEDDAISKLLIMKAVTKFSSEVLAVSTGRKAVEACRNNPDIDLIMMDINMPVMNGYEATEQIRKFNKNVIIIAQTANAFAGDKNNAIEAGCNDYISKPINRDLLSNLIRKYFE